MFCENLRKWTEMSPPIYLFYFFWEIRLHLLLEFFYSEHKTSVARIQIESDIFRNQKAFKVDFTNPKKHSMVGFTKRLAIKKKKKEKKSCQQKKDERTNTTQIFLFLLKALHTKKTNLASCLVMAISRQNFRFEYFTNH